jgi:hypothetical protein
MTIAREEAERELPSSNSITRRKNIQSRYWKQLFFKYNKIPHWELNLIMELIYVFFRNIRNNQQLKQGNKAPTAQTVFNNVR